ncbi:MAG: TonB-dependent receptor [Bacteroidales bacterium]|nr:TonB-dependent receptor [Bacteroidales bacterium]
MPLKHTILTLLLLSSTYTLAQNITGTIRDAETNEPLTGAYVIWAGTSRGAVTDTEGHFSAAQPEGMTKLVATFVGYVNDTIDISKTRDVTFRLKTATLEEVEISARKAGQNMNRMSALATIDIGASELYKAACCNLGESFETNASVDVNYADAATGAKTIQMLGLSGRYVQMLVENVPNLRLIASPFGLSYVPGPWMDGIQVSKGVGTVVNGYEAFTGQINIEYKKPTSNQLASANIFAATNGRTEVNTDVTAHIGNHASTAILVNASKDIRSMDENHDGFRDEPTTKQLNLINRWNYHNDRGYNLHFTLKTLNEERRSGQMDFKGSDISKSLYGIYIKTDRVETWMKNAFVFNSENNLGIATGYIYHHQHSFYGQQTYGANLNSYNVNVIYNRTWDDEKHALHAGVSSQGDIMNEKGNGSVFINSHLEDISIGAFAQYTLKLEDILTVIAGIRGDKNSNYGTFFTPRLHIRYAPTQNTIIRAAIGKGYRTGALMAENNYLLTSSRKWYIGDVYGQEKAWNMGLNVTQYVTLFDKQLTLNAEYYRTEFQNQMTTDFDYSAREMHAYFSEDRSFANNIQIEAKYEPIRNLEVTAAWRRNDTKQTTGGKLQSRPLVSRYKGLVTLSYATPLKTWQFDMNMQLSGGGRIPTTAENPIELQRPTTFGSYQMYNAQITKLFRRWSVYLGCENIGNYTQFNPIIDAENPYGQYFDSSLIWGPLMTRKFYLGIRWGIDRE